MLREEDRIRLQHMFESATEAIEYAAGFQQNDLAENRVLFHVLTHCLEIVGEAANQVSDEIQTAHPAIPWRLLVGMRNRLIHAYFDIDVRILWRTVTEDLPTLAKQIQDVLVQDEGQG